MATLESLPVAFLFRTAAICSAMYALVRREFCGRFKTKFCAGTKYNVAAACCADSLLRNTCATATVAHVNADWCRMSVPSRRRCCSVADRPAMSAPFKAFSSWCVSLQPLLTLVFVGRAARVGSVNLFIILSRCT